MASGNRAINEDKPDRDLETIVVRVGGVANVMWNLLGKYSRTSIIGL